MKLFGTIALFVALTDLSGFGQKDKAAKPPASADGSKYVPVLRFDPKREAEADIQAAIVEAQKTNKRVLLDIGGDWCGWCHVLDEFYKHHPDLADLRDKNFITVAIFYDSENKNEKALSKYGKPETIPYFFLLENDGTLLHSASVLELETGGEPRAEKVRDFLLKWSPPENPEKKAN